MWTHPLRVLLSLLMVILLVGVSGILISLDYQRARHNAIESATTGMTVFSDRLGDRFRILFGDTLSLVNLASVSDTFLRAPPDALAGKVDFLRRGIAGSPQIDGAYVGYPDGTFVHVVSLQGSAGWRAALAAPVTAAFAFRSIEGGSAGERLSTWTFLDANGKTLQVGLPVPANYDPRPRPWYRAAVGDSQPTSTQPYRMATTGSIGLTVAQAHRGDPGVVIGADVLLDTIGGFLARERVSPGAVSVLLDPSGAPIIRSAMAAGAFDPTTAIAAGVRLGQTTGFIDADGHPYIVDASVVDLGPLLKGDRIVVAAPLDELTADARRGMRTGLGGALLVVAAGIGSALLMANWISRALQTLAGDVERLHRFDFEAPIKLRSHVAEISALESAIAKARDAIRTFGMYVPKEIVRRIVGAGQFRGRSAQRQDITAMFTDIYDFTTISERHSPEKVVEMLSAYFDIFSEIVADHDGAIIQFLGDSVFAMWNAPIRDTRHVVHACSCALELRAKLNDFNAARRELAQPELRTRFGIHTGPAVVGSVGAMERLQYTGIGDTLNVASRLEGMNKVHGTEILVSDAVAELCARSFIFRPLGLAHAKGRAADLEICELVGPALPSGPRSSAWMKTERPMWN